MQVITPRPILATASPRNIRPIALFWMLGVGTLMLGGCVSQQTYETARHEVKTRATELAQTQADIRASNNNEKRLTSPISVRNALLPLSRAN